MNTSTTEGSGRAAPDRVCPVCHTSVPPGQLLCAADGARPVGSRSAAALRTAVGESGEPSGARASAGPTDRSPRSTATATDRHARPAIASLILPGERTIQLRPGDQIVLGRAAPGAIGRALTGFVTVSRHHADLAVLADAVIVTDRGSSGHTYVEGERLRAGQSAELRRSGIIRLAASCVLPLTWYGPTR